MIGYGHQYIDDSDIEAVVNVLKSDYLTQGPSVTKFEQKICEITGAKYCVSVSNATAGLHIAVAALELGEGSEGITTPNTFLASSNCMVYNNVKPVFADINPVSYNIDPLEIEKRITDKTKLLIPVHFAGLPCEMEKIAAIAKKNDLHVIEDAAHAIGSQYTDSSYVGNCNYSDMTVFSFHPVKTITTGEGGAVTTNDEKFYQKLCMLRSHGTTKDGNLLTKNPGAWYYEMQSLGFNYRMTDMQAALGCSQLAKLDFFKKRRREIVAAYSNAFAGMKYLNTPTEPKEVSSCFHLYAVQIDFSALGKSRPQVMQELRDKGIGTQVHYIPVPAQPFYKETYGYKEGDYPNIRTAIEGGRSQITGDFTVEEAQDLANVLKSGKMTAKVDIISDMVIGPTLGKQAVEAGLWSFVVALVLLMIFMCCIYGIIPGLIANFGLICNLFFTFGILASFQAVLTLSGIAGIVLALGMAVDANVLIFERAKEELHAGKTVRTAIADGYSNAFSAIFDSNLTSIITGVILLFFGTGPIKGFATTLIIGIICSFFTAVYLTRIIFIAFGKKKAFQNLTFSTGISRNFFANTHFNFLGARKVSFSVVGAFVAIVVISLFVRGLNQGIDFSGGRNYVVKFEKPVDTGHLQQVLTPVFNQNGEVASVSVITIENSNQVRVSTNYKIKANEDASAIEGEITNLLYETFKAEGLLPNGMTLKEFSTTDETQGILSSQTVGPTVANDMRNKAYIAVVLSLLAMFLYILLRFRNVAFSLGALAAVAFTAFSIIGFYSLFWGILPFAMEIDQTFIAAILTIIGYQINDTVVVFDRVRENVALYPKQDFFTTINKSLNSTLTRTIMTSVSTLLVLVCIFILGGDSIRSFIFAMLFGVITGTLSTLFIASPVAYLTNKRKATAAAK